MYTHTYIILSVTPLERELEALRQIAVESAHVASELRRVQSLFDVVYKGTENIERELQTRGADLAQLREEVCVCVCVSTCSMYVCVCKYMCTYVCVCESSWCRTDFAQSVYLC